MDTIAQIIDSFSENEPLEALTETGRFLYVYNSTTLIASVGAIVGLILLGSLLWIAVATALKADKYGGGHGGSGYYRHSRGIDDDERDYTFLELLAVLDETFRKVEINDFDCQKRAVCEAHLRHAESKVGPTARRISYVFKKLDEKSLSGLEPDSAQFFREYFQAAEQGKKNENCAEHYTTCSQSLRDYITKSINGLQ